MKTVYMFYLVGRDLNSISYPGIDDDDIETIDGCDIVLYAWTTSKDARKRFIETRDMSKFVERKEKMDRYKFDEFQDERDDWLLADRPLTTRGVEDGVFVKDVILVLSTGNEVNHIIMNNNDLLKDDIFEPLLLSNMIDISCFIEEVQFLLKYFMYEELMEFCHPYDPLPFYPLEFDNFSVYVHIYKNTFKKE